MANKRLCANLLLTLAALFFHIACKTKTDTVVASDREGYDKHTLNKHYDWTGTYELRDKDFLYVLKLHKRSVDGSYEMQFYNNGKNTDLYKSSIFDAKDDDAGICIRFLNNFQMDARPLGFNSGDTLFILQHLSDRKDSTVWKRYVPSERELQFIKISNTY